MRILKGLCVLALAICIAGTIYAETQSVKISGDLTIRSINRRNYDLNNNHSEADGTRTGNSDDWQTYFMSTAEVQIDADLTDNVLAVLRLYNERDWNVRTKSIAQTTNYLTAGLADSGYTRNADEFQVNVDLAYIELKEFLYSPLTLRVGRQDIWLGKGFIVGCGAQLDPANTINADEYSTSTAFDAIRATLDYDPWTIDVIAAKIWENDIQSADDETLYGVNVGYIFDMYNAEAETYLFFKDDNSKESWLVKQGNDIYCSGLRGSVEPIENWTVAAEAAYQWGWYTGSRTQVERRRRSAWAVDASVECRQFQDMVPWQPKIGLEYIYYSGNKKIADELPGTTGNYTGWDIFYRGKYDSAIRDYYGLYYVSQQDTNNVRSNMYPPYPDSAWTNQHQIIVAGSVQPTDSLTVDCRYFNFWQQYRTYYINGSGNRDERNRYIGSEVDVELTWDYTEDVAFGFLAAWFFPGGHYYSDSDSIAGDYVASVKLSF